MFHRRIARMALATAAASLALTLTACNADTTGTSASSPSTGKATTAAAQPKAKATKKKQQKPTRSQSLAQEFKAYVAAHGTGPEKSAAGHVRKVQGGDTNNDILDTADIYTDYTGTLMDSGTAGKAKLLASAFRDFQQSRGKASKNGLVTVYNANGDILANGNF